MTNKMVHVRVFEEGRSFIAQCLEFDVTGHGANASAALENFRLSMCGHVALSKRDGKEPFADLLPTPFPYWLGIQRPELVGVWIRPDEIGAASADCVAGEAKGNDQAL